MINKIGNAHTHPYMKTWSHDELVQKLLSNENLTVNSIKTINKNCFGKSTFINFHVWEWIFERKTVQLYLIKQNKFYLLNFILFYSISFSILFMILLWGYQLLFFLRMIDFSFNKQKKAKILSFRNRNFLIKCIRPVNL